MSSTLLLPYYLYTFDGVLIVIAGQRELPFLMLGATPGVSRTYFPSVADGSSQAIHIPGGFPFGQSNQTIVYVHKFKLYIQN